MKGVILAAGLGTRMRPLTHRRPKPLVPVLDRPMIEHIVLGAREAGVTDLLIVIGYRGDMVREALGTGERFGLEISYVVQERQAGTGDAALLAEEFVEGEPFFLSWGDIIVSARNYGRLRRVWEDKRPDLLLTVNVVDDPYEGAAVYVEDGRVVRIVEKPPKGTAATNYNNAGVFVLPPQILDLTKTVPLSPRGERELPDAIQRLLTDGAFVGALPIEGCWSDVARPGEVIRLNGALLAEAEYPEHALLSPTSRIAAGVALTPPYIIGPGVSVEAGARIGPGATLQAGASVGAGGSVTQSLVLSSARLGDGCTLEWAVVEEGMEAAPGTELVGTRESPAYLVPDEEV